MATVGLISLGCPRNLVDSEVMLGLLKTRGFKVTEDFNKCDVAVVNTCSFIKEAKEESVGIILQLIALKKEKKLKAIIVAGCLPQRYAAELKDELREVDCFLGTSDFTKITDAVEQVLTGTRLSLVSKKHDFLYNHSHPRDFITPRHFVYVKLSEGCNNACSYCIIPQIRGHLRSREISSVLKEAKAISKRHKISEINLIGQDITLYGTDLYGEPRLDDLLRQLVKIKPAHWIRLLYTHPSHYTDGLIETIKNEPLICKYLDLPLQHINDRILKLMNRGTTKRQILLLLKRLRKEIPGLGLRTTFITGFPTETDAEFGELTDFIKDTGFERLGVFDYSAEEGTAAFNLKGQIPEKVRKERLDVIMKLQQEISREVNKKYLGKEMEVLVDEVSEPNRPNGPNRLYICRTQHDAPEVDGNCFIRSGKHLKPGDFIKAKITDTLEYDLVGEETT